jgi:polyisoprenyl-phosphate glycosyltransferase
MSGRQLKSLSIVSPFYNEEEGAEIFYQTVSEELDKLNIPYEFVFVDDGSRDRTLAVLNQIAIRDSRVRVLSLSRNFGHQIALTAGLDYAEGEAVVVMDSDLQHPPQMIPQMIQEYEKGAEVVYGVRENDNNRNIFKRTLARWYYQFLKKTTNLEFVPGAVDFRLISQEVLLHLREMREMHRYLRGMVPWLGYMYSLVHYRQQKRFAGTSSYTWRKLIRLARHGLFSFSTIPLDVITWLGVLITGLALLYLIYIVVATFVLGRVIPGWTSLVVAVLILGGVQLISIGVLAQYVGMIFEQVKGRPLYILKQNRKFSEKETDSGFQYQIKNHAK